MSRISSWSYLVYAALAALVAAIKGFLYAHLLDVVQYASVNYYLLILGVGVLLVGSGVMVRCHTEIPLLIKSGESGLADFVREVKSTGFLCWVVISALVFFGGWGGGLDWWVKSLSIFQVLVFFLFTVDLMLVKGRLDFVGYAKKLFLRNALIALAGFIVAYFTSDASATIAAEVVCASLLYFRGLFSFVCEFRMPGGTFLRESLSFMPVTLIGALLQFSDRLIASSVLGAEEFSRFSYFSLIVMAGLSLQQLVNTRVITVLPDICRRSSVDGFKYVLKVSIVMGVGLLALLTMGMFILQSPWFAAKWAGGGYALGGLFVLIALVRSIDFYTSYLLVLGRKRLLFVIQCVVVVFFLLMYVYFYFGGKVAFGDLLIFVLCGFSALLLMLVICSWRVRHDVEIAR
ncbi:MULTISPECIES: hypothetical protein [Pseudomonas]|uniref:Polysaccharide biosynthesis protein n=1 Tax=Pseudomonas taiwanensis TaxID=470150 RepID=A0ABR6V7G1_9PSED|nr:MULTISPECIES: hypothetical protein [Pseudomonas]AVD86530.1 hypothetical protein C4Q26_05000 [Pseudomonas sp. SWI44]MBC3476309.1 hypothetical protein [Pseudomonas taiwanensis]MBC3494001.1 hypothetical protein [Pseudomonas taiwanensis]